MFGFATLTACALGQVLSDTAGVLLRNKIESSASRLGIRPPNVTSAQRTLASFRWASLSGALIGVIAGCILGMVHLLYYEHDVRNQTRLKEKLEGILEGVMSAGPQFFDCEIASLFLLDQEKKLLYTRLANNNAQDRSFSIARLHRYFC